MGPHSLHSPFLFQLYNQVIVPSRKKRLTGIETLRKTLRRKSDVIETMDFKSGRTQIKTLGSIARSSSSSPKFSTMLHLLAPFLQCQSILETGTCLGITSCYLAASSRTVTSIEGSGSLAALARKNVDTIGYKNIQIIQGDLHQVLESAIVQHKPDFYFLDADHRSNAVAFCLDLILRHTPDTTCIVIHDIYWSKDMMELWQSLIEDPRFVLTIDLFQAGILFPNRVMEKQHFTLRF